MTWEMENKGGLKMNTRKISAILSVVLVASLVISLFGTTTVAQQETMTQVPFTEDYSKYQPFFSITQIAPIGNKVREQYTQAVNLDMPKIGIQADFKMLEFGDLINREFNNYYGKTFEEDGFDISSFGWSVGVDPDPFDIFHSSAMTPIGNNVTFWYCPESDEMLAKARVEVNQETRKEYLWRWQEIIEDEKPYCVVYVPLLIWSSTDKLEGFDPLMWLQNYSLETWEIPGKDTIVYGSPAAVEGMLPWRWNSVYGRYLHAQIFESLWMVDNNLMMTPRLGESATPGPTIVFAPSAIDDASIEALAPDVKKCKVNDKLAEPVVFPEYFDIKIRQGIMFHDGVEMTSDDVKWSMDAVISADTAFQGWGTFRDIYESSEILDKYTLRVYVGMPHAAWILYCNPTVLPKHVYGSIPITGPEAATKWMESDINRGENVVGSGPFMFDSWEADQFWKMKKTPNYWGLKYGVPDPQFEYFLIKLIPEREAARVALETGEIDIMDTYYQLGAIAKDLEATPGLKLWTTEDFGYQHLHFNCRNPYLANKYVRQAISHCIDRQGIVDNLLGGYGVPGRNPVAVPSWAFNTNIPPDSYDLVMARQLMDKAGYRYFIVETAGGTSGEQAGGGLCLGTLFIALMVLGGNLLYLKRKD
jgi:ABC-type transport system substrate-binding protein